MHDNGYSLLIINYLYADKLASAAFRIPITYSSLLTQSSILVLLELFYVHIIMRQKNTYIYMQIDCPIGFLLFPFVPIGLFVVCINKYNGGI